MVYFAKQRSGQFGGILSARGLARHRKSILLRDIKTLGPNLNLQKGQDNPNLSSVNLNRALIEGAKATSYAGYQHIRKGI